MPPFSILLLFILLYLIISVITRGVSPIDIMLVIAVLSYLFAQVLQARNNIETTHNESENMIAGKGRDHNADFDTYKRQYIPGYSDIILYNKDGADPFASLSRGTTEAGLLKWGDATEPLTAHNRYGDKVSDKYTVAHGDGERGDNKSAYMNARLQKRAKEAQVNKLSFTRNTFNQIYGAGLKNNEQRDWWDRDNMYYMKTLE